MARPGALSMVVLVVAIAFAVEACGASTTAPGLLAQTEPPSETQLPVEETTPKPTKKPAATGKGIAVPSGKYYKPPGWDGSSDVNCSDFDTHAHSQSFFKGTGGSKSNDPYGLDGDHDGLACETLP